MRCLSKFNRTFTSWEVEESRKWVRNYEYLVCFESNEWPEDVCLMLNWIKTCESLCDGTKTRVILPVFRHLGDSAVDKMWSCALAAIDKTIYALQCTIWLRRLNNAQCLQICIDAVANGSTSTNTHDSLKPSIFLKKPFILSDTREKHPHSHTQLSNEM